MSGRGKGGKGLGVYHPIIDHEDAESILIAVLPRGHRDTVELIDRHETLTSIVENIFDGNRSTARQKLNNVFERYNRPTIRSFRNISTQRPIFDAAVTRKREQTQKKRRDNAKARHLAEILARRETLEHLGRTHTQPGDEFGKGVVNLNRDALIDLLGYLAPRQPPVFRPSPAFIGQLKQVEKNQ